MLRQAVRGVHLSPGSSRELGSWEKHLQRTSLSNKKLKDEWENDRENDQFLGLPKWCYNLPGPSGSLE